LKTFNACSKARTAARALALGGFFGGGGSGLGRSRLALTALLAATGRLLTLVFTTLAVRAAFAFLRVALRILDVLAGLVDFRLLAATVFRFEGAEAFFTGTGVGCRLAAGLDVALTGCTFFTEGFADLEATAFLAGVATTLFGFSGDGLLDLGVTVILPGL
jgi:hypothetical protein